MGERRKKFIYIIGDPAPSRSNRRARQPAVAFTSPKEAAEYIRNRYAYGNHNQKVTRMEVVAEDPVAFEMQVVVKPPKELTPKKTAAKRAAK